ncbi:MAG: LamG domain-containing protein [Pseudomonadales bacterium]
MPINGGFESPVVGVFPPAPVEKYKTSGLYAQRDVDGWSTYGPSGLIEIWGNKPNPAPYEGLQYAETQAKSMHAIYQDLPTVPGSTLRWSFAHRGRLGTDTIQVLLGPPGSATVQGTFATGPSKWKVYSGSYAVPAGQTVTRLELKPRVSGYGSSSVGNYVDAVEVSVTCDYGDAADTFPVLAADDGAAHVVGGPHLGAAIDADADGQPSAAATGDDATGTDDEDGLPVATSLEIGGNSSVIVTASSSGYLSAWLDLNLDGVWQPSEKVVSDRQLAAGANTVPLPVPDGATPGQAALRLRLSPDNAAGSMQPGGFWPGGEVEDHLVLLERTPYYLWHFDEAQWSNAADDVLGVGNDIVNGRASGGSTTVQGAAALTGEPGTCSYGHFDGVDDVVELGPIASLDLDYPAANLTLAAWVRPERIDASEQMILVRGLAGTNSTRLELGLLTAGGQYLLRQLRGTGSVTVSMSQPNSDLGQWVHVAAVYDGSLWRLYRNGVQAATSAATNGPIRNRDAWWAVGGRHSANGGGSHFQGDIDEVRLWRRALSGSEVAALPMERHACPQPSLMVVKSVVAEADGTNSVHPKSLPASTAVYSISVSNGGPGATDDDSVVVVDALPAQVVFYSGDFSGTGSPLEFLDGTPPSGLTFDYTALGDLADSVEFLDAGDNPVVPNGGFDPNVRKVRIRPTGRMRPAPASFQLRFRVRLE